MRQQRYIFGRSSGGIGSLIVGVLILVGIFFLFAWIAKGVFELLAYLAPVMLIATAIIRYQVIVQFVKWIWNTLRKEPLMGILYILLTVVGFPIVLAYLLFKAIASRKLEKIKNEFERREEVKYTEYEVIEDRYLDINSEEDLDKYNEMFDKK